MPLYSLKRTQQQRQTKIFWLNVMNRCRWKSNLMDDNTNGCGCRPVRWHGKLPSFRGTEPLKRALCGAETTSLNVCRVAFISAPISMCLPCASYLEGLFKLAHPWIHKPLKAAVSQSCSSGIAAPTIPAPLVQIGVVIPILASALASQSIEWNMHMWRIQPTPASL